MIPNGGGAAAFGRMAQTEGRDLDRYTSKAGEWRSCVMLLPVAAFALLSAAAEREGALMPRSTAFTASSALMALCFCAIAALIIPSRRRYLQMACVTASFTILAAFDYSRFNSYFQYHTACICSALSSALVFLPSDKEERGGDTARLCLYGLLVPAGVHFLILTSVRALDSFISLTFTSGFVTSGLAAAVVPCYTVMQTMGVSGLINAVESLQYPDPHILAIPSAVTLTNLVSLPAAAIAGSLASSGARRVFLTLLGFLAAISASSGPCVSAELAVLLIFFPGIYALLLASSVFAYLCAYALHASVVTNFYLLYQPNLTLIKTTGFSLASADLACIALSAAIPAALLLASSLFLRRRDRALSRPGRAVRTVPGATLRSRPDLIAIAILRACGGLSNLSGVNRQGRELLLGTYDSSLVSEDLLSRICARRPSHDRARGYTACDLGASCAVVAERLRALLRQCGLPPGMAPRGSQDFSIRDYLITKHQRSRGEGNDRRQQQQ